MESNRPGAAKFALIACFAGVLTIFAALSQRISAALGIFAGTFLVALACGYAVLLIAFIWVWKKNQKAG